MNISSVYHLISKTYTTTDNDVDLYIAAKQISQSVILSRDVEADDELTYLNEENEETKIYLDEGRIVKKPGFEIFVFDIDDLDFSIKNDLIYMNVERDNKKYSFLVGSVLNE